MLVLVYLFINNFPPVYLLRNMLLKFEHLILLWVVGTLPVHSKITFQKENATDFSISISSNPNWQKCACPKPLSAYYCFYLRHRLLYHQFTHYWNVSSNLGMMINNNKGKIDCLIKNIIEKNYQVEKNMEGIWSTEIISLLCLLVKNSSGVWLDSVFWSFTIVLVIIYLDFGPVGMYYLKENRYTPYWRVSLHFYFWYTYDMLKNKCFI